jgi:uncharacterized protein (TIGR02246 family)
MKHTPKLTTRLAIAMLASPMLLFAQEQPSPEIAGLEKAAADFVEAFNKQDASAIAALFTEDGEMADLSGTDLTSGREEIKARYEEIFSNDPPQMAVEVESVRLVAPNLAIEDGTAHFTPGEDEEAPPRSVTYTAVLMKNADGVWQIASTRDLKDSTDAAGNLSDLADVIKGEWTSRTADGLKMDLAFGWDKSGKVLAGETLTTSADGEAMEGSARITWDAARKSIVSWIFDGAGGSTLGLWTPTETGWVVRSEGTTADGESMTSNQELTQESKDVLVWAASNRVINGELQPDATLRIVRQVPEPADLEPNTETTEESAVSDTANPTE